MNTRCLPSVIFPALRQVEWAISWEKVIGALLLTHHAPQTQQRFAIAFFLGVELSVLNHLLLDGLLLPCQRRSDSGWRVIKECCGLVPIIICVEDRKWRNRRKSKEQGLRPVIDFSGFSFVISLHEKATDTSCPNPIPEHICLLPQFI